MTLECISVTDAAYCAFIHPTLCTDFILEIAVMIMELIVLIGSGVLSTQFKVKFQWVRAKTLLQSQLYALTSLHISAAPACMASMAAVVLISNMILMTP